MSFKGLKFVIAGLAGASLLCSTALAQSVGEDEQVTATMIIYLDPSVQFFNPVVRGAQDAAEDFNVSLDVQYANNDPVRQNDLIDSAAAAGVDGIAVAISSSDAFDEAICSAVDQGIIVIGFNNDDLEGASGNCRQAYVGMDEEASGYELGQRMIEEFDLQEGDVVFNPREIPEATFAVARGGGIERAMGEVGITVETVRAGLDPAEAQNIMTQFLIANPDVKAVFGTGSVTSTVGAFVMRASMCPSPASISPWRSPTLWNRARCSPPWTSSPTCRDTSRSPRSPWRHALVSPRPMSTRARAPSSTPHGSPRSRI